MWNNYWNESLRTRRVEERRREEAKKMETTVEQRAQRKGKREFEFVLEMNLYEEGSHYMGVREPSQETYPEPYLESQLYPGSSKFIEVINFGPNSLHRYDEDNILTVEEAKEHLIKRATTRLTKVWKEWV